jgi:hypothetical protein
MKRQIKEFVLIFTQAIQKVTPLKVVSLLFIFALSGISVMAQEPWGSSNSLDATATNITSYIYNTARWPVSGLAMCIAIPVFFWADNGRRKAMAIAGAILVWAMAPWLVSLFKTVTNT